MRLENNSINLLSFYDHHHTLQDELAMKQKMKEDKKKMEEARSRAAQKGPMGI